MILTPLLYIRQQVAKTLIMKCLHNYSLLSYHGRITENHPRGVGRLYPRRENIGTRLCTQQLKPEPSRESHSFHFFISFFSSGYKYDCLLPPQKKARRSEATCRDRFLILILQRSARCVTRLSAKLIAPSRSNFA